MTSLGQWQFVPGTMNPADIVSRGLLLKKIKCADSWFLDLLFNPPSTMGSDRPQKLFYRLTTTLLV